MEITFTATAIIAAVAAAFSWALTHFIVKGRYTGILAEKDAAVRIAEAACRQQRDSAAERIAEVRESCAVTVAQMRESQRRALEAAKNELALESEKALKAREEELHRRNIEEMRHITGPLNEQIRTMADALEAQKAAHTRETAAMVTKFEETARSMKEQTESIGGKADSLAEALKGGNKMQGNWGERIIQDILDQEGLLEGRDYDKEEYLRDRAGAVVFNEDSGRRMRPDYILHFPDSTDVIVDAKMNIDAFVDWFNAKTEGEKEDARRRNLAAVKAQVRGLSGKTYQAYVRNGRKTLDYVVMYVSNYGALQLAKQLEPNIVNEAFRQNVLITTEETFMPFLRMIHTAWVNVEQIRNQEMIVKQASYMCERVSDLCSDLETVGKSLEAALQAHGKASKKLRAEGTSILHAAREVVQLGVPMSPKKKFPDPVPGAVPSIPEESVDTGRDGAQA